jgi:hypothetical protein
MVAPLLSLNISAWWSSAPPLATVTWLVPALSPLVSNVQLSGASSLVVIWAVVAGSCAPDGSPVTSKDPAPPRLYCGCAPSCSGALAEKNWYVPALRSTTTVRLAPGAVSPTPPAAWSHAGIGAVSSLSMTG